MRAPPPSAGWIVGALALAIGCALAVAEAPKPETTSVEAAPAVSAEEALAGVIRRYEAARAEGPLTGDGCAALAGAFDDVYRVHGPAMIVAHFDAGAVWEACGDTEAAAKIYQEVVEVRPDHAPAHNNLGVLAWGRGEEAAALAAFTRAIELDPGFVAARDNLASALRARYVAGGGEAAFVAAERVLQQALAADPQDPRALAQLARLYDERGRRGPGEDGGLAERVIDQGLAGLPADDPRGAPLLTVRGLAALARGDEGAALRAFKAAVARDPADTEAHLHLARLALQIRDEAAAEASLGVVLRDPRRGRQVDALITLGAAQRGLGRLDDAERSFQRAAALASDDPRPRYNLGLLYQERRALAQDDQGARAYGTAKEHYERFIAQAHADPTLTAEVADARARIDAMARHLAEQAEVRRLHAEAERRAAANTTGAVDEPRARPLP